jgi:DNA-binding transcriptional LysR family regulator
VPPSPRFSPRQLDAFVAAAELNNFTYAARRLNLTPSAVSNLISELELTVGFALFERTTRKVTLTADGREFLPAALAVQRQMSLAATAAADVRNRSVDVIRVAAPLSVACLILPRLIGRYREQHPRSAVRILDTGVEWLADSVATGEADLALGPDRTVGGEVACEALFASPWVLWCSPRHPLAAKSVLTWSDLEGAEFYASGRDHEHSVAPELAGRGIALIAPVQIVGNITTALGVAAANLGVTFAPAYVRGLAEPLGLVMRRVVDPEVIRYVSLYAPTRRALSAAALQFHNFLRESLTDASHEAF